MDDHEDRRVFEDEASFLAAEPHFTGENGNSTGYVVSIPGEDRQYWVWASQRDHALGIFNKFRPLISVIPYQGTQQMLIVPEGELGAMFGSLAADLQDKVRRHVSGHSCPYCNHKVEKRTDLPVHIRSKHPAR